MLKNEKVDVIQLSTKRAAIVDKDGIAINERKRAAVLDKTKVASIQRGVRDVS